MSLDPVILAIDAGTTSGRVIAFDQSMQMVAQASRPLRRFHPQSDWVEQDPDEIWRCIRDSLAEVLGSVGDRPVCSIGITNQRETTIVWNRSTGEPIYPAIVWQCRRTTSMCADLSDQWGDRVKERTGLPLDPYFSASKIRWILDHCPDQVEEMKNGNLAFGTVDTWLIWKLTDGEVHATDPSNASRTLLYGLSSGIWESELLDLFGLDAGILPEIRSSAGDFGSVAAGLPGKGIPITGVLGDQQAALFGQGGWHPGVLKNTYGTGLFLMACTGNEIVDAGRLVSTVAWEIDGNRSFAVEGSVFIGGALIQWLRDDLGILENAAQSEDLAKSVSSSEGVVFVPALAGLGAPWWDPDARGMIIGITQSTTSAHIVRAALESLAWQTRDLVESLPDSLRIDENSILRVDGGACANECLMQMQADVLGISVERPLNMELTALGAAAISGIGADLWRMEDLERVRRVERVFNPSGRDQTAGYSKWRDAVGRSRGWASPDNG